MYFQIFKGLGAALFACVMFALPANAVTVAPAADIPGFVVGFDNLSSTELDAGLIYKTNIDQSAFPTEGAGFVAFEFINAIGGGLTSLTSNTVNPTGSTSGLEIFWSNDATGLLASAISAIVGVGVNVSQSFLSGETHFLIVKWAGLSNGANIDLNVTAVPIPASVLLLGTSLLGMGILARRRRRKTATGMVAA